MDDDVAQICPQHVAIYGLVNVRNSRKVSLSYSKVWWLMVLLSAQLCHFITTNSPPSPSKSTLFLSSTSLFFPLKADLFRVGGMVWKYLSGFNHFKTFSRKGFSSYFIKKILMGIFKYLLKIIF